ncbi:MAG: DUF2786 domain-containing protein [Lentisphaerae bacterium]|jgi:hypothetical protein|nr:DUF2786 domain-containing protein [Lentisphaerota bacterium]MBT4816074.1 DUF2786 domain-containing protein [Lentisphaerota bacterium]MBT5613159.1 DUF2786 domain-containing protein [Lentisphaerota bacterium]MBT7061943.1 DUF2786 domain-containing protein [Lentisphaerota bacterium]MBT7844549.1 DUF2786 domain-containing protein [Lentisphaerota bacterium]
MTPTVQRRILWALAWEWKSCCGYYLTAQECSRLKLPVFTISTSLGTWGRWTGGRANEIALSERLFSECTWDDVTHVLRHEVAHQLVEHLHGSPAEPPHGPTFQAMCARLGIPGWASFDVEPLTTVLAARSDRERPPIERKIHKLLALAESPNRHEAEAAAAKAYALAVRHNLALRSGETDAEYISLTLGETVTRRDLYLKRLANVLQEYYFVRAIWIRRPTLAGQRVGFALEVSGATENVLTAQYVHALVVRTIVSQWGIYRKAHGRGTRHGPRGMASFALGVIEGFENRLARQMAIVATDHGEAFGLIKVEEPALKAYLGQRYPRVSTRTHRHSSNENAHAYSAGQEVGRELVVRRPIRGSGVRGRQKLLPGL